MPRNAGLTIRIGGRGSGKSQDTLDKLQTAVKNGRKVLIFDGMNEYAAYPYHGQTISIKAIYYRDIPRFTAQYIPEMVRTIPFFDDGRRMSTDDLQDALERDVMGHFRNGILLVEDTNKYITDTISKDTLGSLATLRQQNVDTIMHFQMMQRAAHPKLLAMANNIVLHKTTDRVEKLRDRFLSYSEIMMLAENIVNRKHRYGIENNVNDINGKYFYVTINLEWLKIRGLFTKSDALKSIEEYLSYDNGREVKSLLNRLNPQGQKIYKNYSEAYNVLQNKLLEQYFEFQ